MVGTEAIIGRLQVLLRHHQGLHHTIINEWRQGRTPSWSCSVTYDRLDEQTVTIPVVSVWTTTANGLISDYRVYLRPRTRIRLSDRPGPQSPG